LSIDALLAVALFFQFQKSKRRVWVGIVLVVVLLAWFVVLYGSFIEPRLLVVNYETISVSKGTQSIKIALISDLHAGPYLSEKFVNKIVDQTNKENPDAVLLAGDFVSAGNLKISQLVPLSKLSATLGVYAIHGNHDFVGKISEVDEYLQGLGIKMLINESAVLKKGDEQLVIVGVDDVWFGNVDFEKALKDVPADIPRVLLAHNPDIVYALRDYKFDAILSAHTHGGQIRLPLIGSISVIPTELGRKFDRGMFDWNGIPLLITSGVGSIGPRARLFVPPEIMMIDFNF